MKRDPRFDEFLFSEQYYNCYNEDLLAYQLKCVNEVNEYNKTPASLDSLKKRGEMLKGILGGCGDNVYIDPPFHANVGGKNVFIGDNFYANFNLALVDDGKITIGNNVMVGPNVTIITAEHPLKAKERNSQNNQRNRPVTIGNDVWICANVVILPGVHVGNGAVLAAGAVVNKDVPDNVLVAGVPAKIIKKIEQ